MKKLGIRAVIRKKKKKYLQGSIPENTNPCRLDQWQ